MLCFAQPQDVLQQCTAFTDMLCGPAVWLCCAVLCRQQGQVQASVVEQQKPALTVQPSGPSKASTGGFGPSSHTGGSTGECASKLEMSSASLATTRERYLI